MTRFRIPEPPYTIESVMEDLHHEFVRGGPPDPASLGWQPDPADEATALLWAAEGGWRVEPDYRIHSHRPLLRYLIDPIKRLIHWGGRPYVRLLIEKQEQFNAKMLALLRVQLARQRELDDALVRLEAEMARAVRLEAEVTRAVRLEAEMTRAHSVFEEALKRGDTFIGQQSRINEYLEQNTQAVQTAEARLEHVTRSLIERYDVAPFSRASRARSAKPSWIASVATTGISEGCITSILRCSVIVPGTLWTSGVGVGSSSRCCGWRASRPGAVTRIRP